MTNLGQFLNWFSGGRDGYMTLHHCMRGDIFWITLTVVLDLAVALGYLLIARHWWVNEKSLPASHAKIALGNMKRIFLFCGTCGYLFIPIKMMWPAWRLYDLFMIALVFFTWRYALNARQLRVVYHELGRSKQLAIDLEVIRAESRRKSFFLNAISHDLRTPLNGLMLQAELAELSSRGGDPESLEESLREIKACARTTADLLGSFLDLGRLDWSQEQTTSATFSAEEFFSNAVNAARTFAEAKNLAIRSVLPPSLYLHTDRIKLERIVQNLAVNAVKFTEQGSIEILVDVKENNAYISVEDTGAGIAEDQQGIIFDEFYQVGNRERDRSKGFGLGLSIARKLAEQLGGRLEVESQVGRGSRFTLFLPSVVVNRYPMAQPHPDRSNRSSPALG